MSTRKEHARTTGHDVRMRSQIHSGSQWGKQPNGCEENCNGGRGGTLFCWDVIGGHVIGQPMTSICAFEGQRVDNRPWPLEKVATFHKRCSAVPDSCANGFLTANRLGAGRTLFSHAW